MISLAKRHYFSGVTSLSSKDDWKRINEVTNLKKKTSFAPEELDAEKLLQFFTSIKSEDDFDTSHLPNATIDISENDILMACKRIKKSGGNPYIPVWVVKKYIYKFTHPLSVLFSASINTGYVPSLLKCSIITPIAKIKNPKNASDYRPISSTSIFLKLLECVFIGKCLKNLFREESFSDQFAFVPLKGRGCQSAITCIYGTILKHVDRGLYVNTLLVDFSKAFDRAAHSRIINELISLGATYQCVFWVSSFLRNWHVSVRFNNSTSTTATVTSGTPQGCIISPLLFAVLISSLRPKNSNVSYFKYADDLTIVHYTSEPSNIMDLDEEICHLCMWCRNNFVTINEAKTQLMHFSNRKKPVYPLVTVNKKEIEVVQSVKLLGVHIQSNLKWRTHVDECIKRASKIFFPILQLKRSRLPSPVITRFYESLVRVHFLYCCPATSNMSYQDLQKLEKAEKRFFLLMQGRPSSSLKFHRQKICDKLANDVVKFENHPIRQLLIKTETSRTRSHRTLLRPNCKTTAMKNSFVKHFI